MKPVHVAFCTACAGILLAAPSCSRKPALEPLTRADTLRIVEENIEFRADRDSSFAHDPNSPFMRDTSVHYHGINWFPIDPAYRGTSLLHTYSDPDTVAVMGTRGETRRELRYGYVEIPVPGPGSRPVMLRLIVYKFTPYDRQRFDLYRDNLSIWFTDSTTGHETYEVGRYLEIGNDTHDPHHLYTIDLNQAYNPFCAYSPRYSCAIPREEDHLAIALRVGEMKYHQ